ncbi:alpha/beta fold hydrolase [Paenibacillus tarimensis]|uniref:alpha/beta fold hydrolase n=1 Tax=Paenibacillus tarimensis TaxID=416012 RepID=UPI001F28B0F7|nr:alpha/beta fold hydrolase [Paenibacillus tarimensis]MCF2943979.1 alpha/beta fold hydrolase [Paenibacillus tarimensis]
MEVHVEGRTIVVHECGDRTNTPVVMIPAMGRPATDFELLSKDLAEAGYWALMFNPRGVNGSTGLDLSLEIKDIASDVHSFLNAIGVSKAHFIGHAFGTRVARLMAELYPGMALSSTSITMGGLLPPELPYPLIALDMIEKQMQGTPEFEKAISDAYFAPGIDGSIWFSGWYGEVIPAYTLALARTPQEELMCGGTAPMLIVQGVCDVFAPVRAGEIMKERLKSQVRLVNIPDSAHEIMHEQPALLSEAVVQFLRDADQHVFYTESGEADVAAAAAEPVRKVEYGLGWGDAVTKFQSKRSIKKYADFLLPHLNENMSVLDCGCGSGGMTAELAQRVSPGRVVGIDVSPKQLKLANELKESKGLHNLEFLEANIYELPFEDASFDAVWMNTLLMHLQKPVEALKEIYRVLRPGGVIGVSDADWDGDIMAPKFQIITGRMALNEKYLNSKGSNMRHGKYNASLLHKAGFEHVSASAMVESWGTPEEVRELAEFSIAVEYDQFSHQASEMSLNMRAETWRKWAAYPGAFFARTHCRAIGWKKAGN